MPAFTYTAKDQQGKLINGTLEAESRSAVTTRLQAMDLFPVEIQSTQDEDNGVLSGRHAQAVKSADLMEFYRQMSDLIGAGVPLVKALTIVKNQLPNPTLAAVVGQVSADVQGGLTFANALDRHPGLFNKLAVAMVRVGEAGGMLDETLTRVADHAEAQEELKGKIKGALAYPVIMVIVGIGAISVLLTYVMPKVAQIFRELDQTLPLMTEVLMSVCDFLQNHWLTLLIGLAVAMFAFRRFIATEAGGRKFHWFLLRLPMIGELILKREIAAFTRTLGSLLRNGVPILNALNISAEVMSNVPVREAIEKIPESITQGSGMAPALRASPLFPPVVVNMVAVGEETGQLPEVLLRVARSYESQVDRAIKLLTSYIEPVIILMMGLLVGYVVISMLLPIFSIDPTRGM